MSSTATHKVFVSFHHEDEGYKTRFTDMMGGNIVDKSVGDGDVNPLTSTDYMRQVIRDDFIADATVTVVLIGKCTWQRKHVDWEIGSSLRDTQKNPRCGLLGILLPSHPDYNRDSYRSHLIPPRLADNCGQGIGYAKIYDWSDNAAAVKKWIDDAYRRRGIQPDPNNGREQFGKNRSGDCLAGWRDW